MTIITNSLNSERYRIQHAPDTDNINWFNTHPRTENLFEHRRILLENIEAEGPALREAARLRDTGGRAVVVRRRQLRAAGEGVENIQLRRAALRVHESLRMRATPNNF